MTDNDDLDFLDFVDKKDSEEKNSKSLFKKILESECKDEASIYDDILTFSKLMKINEEKTEEKTEEYNHILKRIGDYIGISDPVHVGIFSAIFELSVSNGHSADVEDISYALEIDYADGIKLKKYINDLCDANIVVEELPNGRRKLAQTFFSVPEIIIEAALDNQPFNRNELITRTSMTDFLKNLIDSLEDASPAESSRQVKKMETLWKKCAGVKLAIEKIPDVVTRGIFYITLHYKIFEDISPCLEKMISSFTHNPKLKSQMIDSFKEKTNCLLTQELCECSESEIFNLVEIDVTEKALKEFLGDEAEICSVKNPPRYMMMPEKIVEKKLFYSDSMNEQLDTLYKIFDRDNFTKMQERLESKGMKKGVAVLLYGAPGTGKTESVLQIAKATGRPVYHVDISETKSCFLGESQKRVKRIFNTYKKECRIAKKNGALIPILLLNEADAIISKRKDVKSSNVAQEENSIQNVLLEEIENLEGILLATTNIPDNLDNAFERRFLFKIKYEKPELKSRVKIWRSKLEHLSEEDAEKLASEYEFSGGEIDNIVRKVEIDEILKGEVPETSRIREMCRREKLKEREERRIGF